MKTKCMNRKNRRKIKEGKEGTKEGRKEGREQGRNRKRFGKLLIWQATCQYGRHPWMSSKTVQDQAWLFVSIIYWWISDIQSHHWIYSELQASLGFMRPCGKKREREREGARDLGVEEERKDWLRAIAMQDGSHHRLGSKSPSRFPTVGRAGRRPERSRRQHS